MSSSWMDKLKKAALTGAIGAGVSAFTGNGGSVSLLNTVSVPGPVGAFAATAGGSIAADVAHDYVLPHIPYNEKFSRIESAALGIAASAAGTAAVLDPTFSDMDKMKAGAMIGAGSFVAGDYAWSKIGGGRGDSIF